MPRNRLLFLYSPLQPTENMKIRSQEIDLEQSKADIEFYRTQNWSFKKWESKPAIRDKSGTISKFVGQKYDVEQWEYLKNGWSHDHCEICFLDLCKSDYVIQQFAYVNESEDWICHECYNKIIREDFRYNEFVLKYKLKLKNGNSYLIISPMVEGLQFEITENIFYGGSLLEKYLDLPRKILENGEQDQQTFVIKLKDKTELENFEENKLYELVTNK